MSKRYKLKSTGQEVHKLQPGPLQPLQAGYSLVLIPYNEIEQRTAKGDKRGHQQVVRNDSIEVLK